MVCVDLCQYKDRDFSLEKFPFLVGTDLCCATRNQDEDNREDIRKVRRFLQGIIKYLDYYTLEHSRFLTSTLMTNCIRISSIFCIRIRHIIHIDGK